MDKAVLRNDGAEKAKEYRDLMSSFQVELMKNKDALAPTLKQFTEQQGSVYREFVTHYDFSYLRKACEAAGLGDVLTVRPEDEEGFLFKMVFTPEQQQAIAYDGAFYEGVTKWIDTTDAKIIFVYGNSDPWYSVRMHDTDNPNVKMYVSNTKPHTVRITDFDQATVQEFGTFASEVLLG